MIKNYKFGEFLRCSLQLLHAQYYLYSLVASFTRALKFIQICNFNIINKSYVQF